MKLVKRFQATRYSMTLKILFIGDIVGKLARKSLQKLVPELRKKYALDAVIANGENSSHGLGISKKVYQELISSQIYIITLGDHAFDKIEAQQVLSLEKMSIIRPANYSQDAAGQGDTTLAVGSR